MNDIKKLTDREHILLRPSMYIGGIDLTKINDFIIDNGKVEYKQIEYVPGLIKIINEIIDNSVDASIRTNFKCGKNISIKITDDTVSVTDDGTGIPVKKSGEHYMPELAWGHTRSGSNFQDDENRLTLGLNGVGAACTNIWSKYFKGVTCDGSKKYTYISKNNAESFTENISQSNITGTTVEFKPDLGRFKIEKIDDTHKNVIFQRLQNLAISYPEINFKFNNKSINFKTFKNYVSLFGENFELYENENIKIGVLPNENDDFKHFSFVNGLKIPDGGTHIDVIASNVTNIIRDKLIKKYKSIKPGDIKNKLMLVVFVSNMKNLKFNSQSKEKLTNSVGEFNNHAKIDYKFVEKILKNKTIMDSIIDVYKIKEELEAKKAMKSVEKNKKIKSEKYFRATKECKYLCICEGQSAYGGIAKLIGNSNVSYYILKGKPLNSFEITPQKLAANKELSELYQIIKNEITFKDIEDGDFFEIEINNKKYIVNENDIIEIDGKKIIIKDYLKIKS